MCSLVACLLASYLLISVNKPHSLWSALLTASYLLSVLSTEFIPHTKLSDNLICILPCGLHIWLVGKIQTNQHLESAYYPPQSANLQICKSAFYPCPKFSNRSIAVAVPTLWNKLPPALRQISDTSYEITQTSPLAISPQLFHSKLKTLLFSTSYPDSSSSPYLLPRLNSKHHPP